MCPIISVGEGAPLFSSGEPETDSCGEFGKTLLFISLFLSQVLSVEVSRGLTDTHHQGVCPVSLVCPITMICGGAEVGDPEGAFSHAPLGQSEGSVSFSLKQLCFSNVPSLSADVILFPESFQLDSKQSFIALCKSSEMTNYFYVQSAVFFFLFLFSASSWLKVPACFVLCAVWPRGSYLKYS